MRQWVRRWELTIRWDSAQHSPRGTTRFQTVVATAAELRHLVERARADPYVTALPYKAIKVLEGEEPHHCPTGHPLGGGSATRARTGWAVCATCPGHHLIYCRWSGCDAGVIIDPAPDDDCVLHMPPAPER